MQHQHAHTDASMGLVWSLLLTPIVGILQALSRLLDCRTYKQLWPQPAPAKPAKPCTIVCPQTVAAVVLDDCTDDASFAKLVALMQW